jgi:hypothetical protein
MNDKNVHYVAIETNLSHLEGQGLEYYLAPALVRLKRLCWDALQKDLQEGEDPKIHIKMTLNIEVAHD